ncbi:hypothetical protein [Pandoravirus japonicus]|uniref:Uncharacterized protein n=1 Tax=Pandoravirus japonicus TaxID=2823154 RepID=A0A811BNN3_9VIRU|nr:hypothetical protein [Pandoravirus japonicus]
MATTDAQKNKGAGRRQKNRRGRGAGDKRHHPYLDEFEAQCLVHVDALGSGDEGAHNVRRGVAHVPQLRHRGARAIEVSPRARCNHRAHQRRMRLIARLRAEDDNEPDKKREKKRGEGKRERSQCRERIAATGGTYALDILGRHHAAARVRGLDVVDGLAHVAVGREHNGV